MTPRDQAELEERAVDHALDQLIGVDGKTHMLWRGPLVIAFKAGWHARGSAAAPVIEKTEAAIANYDKLAGENITLREALEFYEPQLRKRGCSASGDHDDPSWCTPLCGDYGKRARDALKALEKIGK